uniref:NADH-ubiquinone oxidoreductase chain 5 n=1 Tax=Polistes jokahamae TaxID=256662 RepID=A0A0F7CZF8_POLJO|nr:NADH dehydrogenase subunit 5 [Polistes hebraeus]AKG64602.1 NADH dehydrogenase subunit 5 [Polistes jokahamae]UMB50753.1 NADH dehydrogenase subunit 5 [Polistes hebraeus]
MMFMNIILLYFVGLFMFILSMIFLFNKLNLTIEFIMMNYNSMQLEFLIYLDWVSLMFLSLVLLISSLVLMYSLMYMEGDMNLKRFFILVLMFVLSMIFLIICPNFMGLLLGWDGLGLTSYCLIIYYQNWKSFNSGMVTVLLNRVGDVSIMMIISLCVTLGSWNGLFYEFNFYLLSMLLLLSAITKSAQLPFSVWLPLAMAAPTPVSSLVHSSTLVTAGVYLLIRYNFYLFYNSINDLLLLISSMTMLMSGLMANFENDLKKIIALSTLSQLGLMMSILSLGKIDLSYFHLVIHALFKSLLFLCSGILIHQMLNNQDIRFMGNVMVYYPFVSLIFFISTLSLCGFPFFSGFYSKDLIMEILLMSKMNFLSMLMLFLATLLTVSYSVRLLMVVFLNFSNKFNSFILLNENNLMSISMILLYFSSLMIGYFLFNLFSLEIIILNLQQKTLVLSLCLIGVFFGIFMSKLSLLNWLLNIKIYLMSMWGSSLFYELINFYPLKYSLFMYKMLDKGLMEYMFSYGIKNFLLKMFLKFLVMNFFLYLNLFMMFILLLILLLII